MNKEQRTTSEGQGPKVDVRGKRVLVLGLARSGRAAAHALRRRGAVVTVTDSRPPATFAAEIPELLSAKIGLELGLHRQETFLRQDFIVVSPGVPSDLPQLVAAHQHRVRILPEVEVASWFLKGKLVGVTGSNGKTTTTTLLGRMLETSGFHTFVGGNIGVPLISVADQTAADSISVAELSSFQLEATQDFHVNVAVLLNITPNHLDRHASFDAYVAAKAGIFRNQMRNDWAVLNADDPTVMSLSPALSSRKVLFSLRQDLPDGVLVSKGKILYRVSNLERVLMDVADVKLRGAFNLENVLAATAAACVLGADFEVLPPVVRDFRGVEHRLEYVRQIRGVDFYNDSKATSVDATVKALSAFECGVHLILGGKDKGAPYAPLRPLLEGRVRRVLLIGTAADQIAKELAGAVDLVRAGDLETAVREAFRVAVPGDTVLLAPACSSFDQFQDFEHRGRVFKQVVERVATEEHAFTRWPEVRDAGVPPVEAHGQDGSAATQVFNLGSTPAMQSREEQHIIGTPDHRSHHGAEDAVEPLPSPEEMEGRLSRPDAEVLIPANHTASGGSAAESQPESPVQQPRELSACGGPLDSYHETRVLSRPELVYVYEVAAEELAPMEGEISQERQGEVYEEFELLRPRPAAGTDCEPFLYEVSLGAGTSDTDTGSQARGSVTARDSRAEAPGAYKSDPPSSGGSSSPEGDGGQGRLFGDRGK